MQTVGTGAAGSGGLKGAGESKKKTRPLAGFLIAGASLAALFAIAALKGRVKDRE